MRYPIPANFVLIAFAWSPLACAASAEKTAPDGVSASQPSAAIGGPTAPAVKETWDSEPRQAALRLQLFLDKEGFGPGKIDGRWGGFSRKAAERWNAAGNSMKIAILENGGLDPAKTKEIPFSAELLTTYEITGQDQAMLGALPGKPREMAKLKELPYASLLELVAEKFHADSDYIREINALPADGDLKVGSKVKVPNVAAPFDISEPMALFKAAEEKKAEENKAREKKAPQTSADDTKKPDSDMELTVLRQDRVVELRKGGELIRSFPISPGANDNQSPAGNWKVAVISWMPKFRWDKSMLEDGKRSDNAYLLPPGPNNPVGVVWIGLSADGIGLHGTPFPDAIGRNQSHGCIRLSNWDALDLGKTVTVGTRVVVK
ncbi:MAG: L,D-transpeptidase [Luteolibacter sp.]